MMLRNLLSLAEAARDGFLPIEIDLKHAAQAARALSVHVFCGHMGTVQRFQSDDTTPQAAQVTGI